MAQYQTKFHKYLCESFKWATFVSVIITLILFLIQVWIPQPSLASLFFKACLTTIGIGISAITMMMLFDEAKSIQKK